MSNSVWRDYATDPPSLDSAVLVWLDKPNLGSRFAILRTSSKNNKVVNGHFLFDLDVKVLCWREIDSLADDLPLKYEGDT